MCLQFSALGKKNKRNFSGYKLFNVVLEAVKYHYPDSSEYQITKDISSVLASAGDWDGGRKKRQNGKN
ncbi:hypothetical protein QE152_g7794 [Popillia japonica]|uniref:Uncharacterized protein n=1 Tax=Popillia japonica TaxID=7064 RepID=A0AAW1ME83_POPJA